MLLWLASCAVQSQTLIHVVDFETQGLGYTTSSPEFHSGSDYFSQTTSNVGVTGRIGSGVFAAQDIDEGISLPAFLNIQNINITGYTNLELRVYLAEEDDGGSQDWDNPDYVHFNGTIDAGGSFNLLWIENDGSASNSAPFIDTDFNGVGDGTEITDAFQQFIVPIVGTGNNLNLEIEFDLDAGDEDIVIDHIEVYGISAPPCTPPTVNSFYPTVGPQNTHVTLTGSGFTNGTGTSQVTVNGLAATLLSVTNTEIIFELPANAQSGDIEVTTNSCPVIAGSFTLIEPSSCVGFSATELIISEIYDAPTGSLSYIELFNGTANPINLAPYLLTISNNGNTPNPININGAIAPNSTAVFYIGSGGTLGTNTGVNSGINDEDCIRLVKYGAVIDMWGVCGSPWVIGGGNGFSYIRKPSVTAPSASFNLSEWDAYNTPFLTNLQSHTMNSSPSSNTGFTTQPVDAIVCEGDNHTFSTTTTGSSNFYQWYQQSGTGNWVAISNAPPYSNTQTSSLTLTNTPATLNTNQYFLEIIDGTCIVPSEAVQITVLDKPISTTIFHNP